MHPDDARERARGRSDLNAFISLTDEEGPGQVVAVKDLLDVRGTVTTGGGVILPPVPAERDAPVIERMRGHGVVVMGKANLHEWAFGVTSQNPHHGTVGNPRAPGRVAGGSSGGSAAAVAAGLCDWAVGSDTGGSIRIPAAYCGVVGFKPTIGTVDTEGAIPLARSLDTLGPLAPDVAGAARALETMSELTGLVPAAPRRLADLRLAVPAGWAEGLDEVNSAAWKRATEGLPEIAFPDPLRLGEPALTMLLVEAGGYHRRWLERYPHLYGADVLRLLTQGLATPREQYRQALLEQSRQRAEVEEAMSGWDALLVPATRIAPPLLDAPYARADLTVFTRPFNTTGHPALCLPLPVDGLPVGIQVVGAFGAEALVVEVGLALEAAWQPAVRRA